jgi:hypothetical protein
MAYRELHGQADLTRLAVAASRNSLGGRGHTGALVAVLWAAALSLSACGGGGGYGGSNSAGDSISQAEATIDGANAARLGSDTGLVADQTVQTLQAALGVGTGIGAGLACPGGGSATVAVTGGSLATQTNGQFDAGEIYTLTLAGCSAAVGAPAISGALTVTVVAADANGATLTIATTTPLSAVLPAGTVNLSGSFTLVRSISGTTTTSHVTTATNASLSLSRGASTRTFTLSAVDITLAATRAAGTLQALAYSGSHTVTINQSVYNNLSYSVATTGSVSYDASAQPTTGTWTVTLPRQILTLGLTATTVHLTADFGKDGTIDLDTTFPRADLLAAVG